MQPVDIRPDHLCLVQDILRQHVPMAEVWAFGSRAKWLARDTSDLDLCIRDAAPLSFEKMGLLREAFEESNLPYKVDVVDWATISASFRKVVERDKVVVQKGSRSWGMGGKAASAQGDVGLREETALVSERGNPTCGTPQTNGGFKESTLGDIAEFRNGKALSNDMYLPFGQHPVFGSNGQIARTNEVLTKEPLVVIERVGAYCGSVHHVDEPAWITDNAIIATGKDQTDVRFLFYLLGSLDLRRTAIGSAQPLMTQGGLKVIPVIVPTLPEQKAIAHILGTLDDKIELNRRMNITLEAMARALFQGWFVDFDPVRAKMEGRQPVGMDEATAALFPDRFEESELGLVPKGWGVERLDGFIELAYGKALKAEDRKLGYVPVYESGGITGWHDTALVNTPSIVIGRKGTVGSLYWESSPFFPIDTVCYVKSRRQLTYCYYLLRTLGLTGMNTDAAVPGLNRENVYRLMVPQPPKILVSAFDATVAPLRKTIDHNLHQSRTLATLRDALLPKLLSGKLSVAAAQMTEVNA